MSAVRRRDRPVPHLDEPQLRRLWEEGTLLPGGVVDVGGRSYRVLGWDSFSVRPLCVYVEELGSGRTHALVVSPPGT